MSMNKLILIIICQCPWVGRCQFYFQGIFLLAGASFQCFLKIIYDLGMAKMLCSLFAPFRESVVTRSC